MCIKKKVNHSTITASRGAEKGKEFVLAICLYRVLAVSRDGEVFINIEDSLLNEMLEPVYTKHGVCVIVEGSRMTLQLPIAELVAKLWLDDFDSDSDFGFDFSNDAIIKHKDNDPFNCSVDNLDVSIDLSEEGKLFERTPITFVASLGYCDSDDRL